MYLLIKKLVKNYQDTENPKIRLAYGKISSAVGISANILLFAFKIFAGLISGSISIAADAFNNLSDAASSVISLVGFKLASRPADDEHPYGHARYEYLAGLTVAALILVIGVELFKSSLSRIFSPLPVEFGTVPFVILTVSIAVKVWLALSNYKIGRKIKSNTLIATAADSRNDVIATSAVLITAVISYSANVNIDGTVGLFVALFIIFSGFKIIKEALDPLLGQAPDEKLVSEIQEKILSYPGVLGTHDLMVHDYGPGRQFASVHVEMAAEDDVLKSHDIIDNIERDFFEQLNLHMVVHFDPIVTSDTAVGDFRSWLAGQVKTIDERLTIHDLRMVPGRTHTNVIFDCVVPPSFHIKYSALKLMISELVSRKYENYYCVITIDTSYAPLPHES